jgi:hypothetical protein
MQSPEMIATVEAEVSESRSRYKQDSTESVQPAPGCAFHGFPKLCRSRATVCSHSCNQAAVRGAFVGASRSS